MIYEGLGGFWSHALYGTKILSSPDVGGHGLVRKVGLSSCASCLGGVF